MSAFQHYSNALPTSGWADGDLFASPWVMNELLKNESELLFLDPSAHETANPTNGVFAPLSSSFPEDFLMAMGGAEESSSSSASSPSSASSASTAPEVPALELPAASPVTMPPVSYVETKNEMVAAVPHGRKSVESTPAVSSNKRKNSTSSRKEGDTKAAAPPQMSKRARANQRNLKREAHNQAERERRDDLKEGFAGLRTVLPTHLCPDRKNQVDLLQAAVKYITTLQSEFERIQQEKAQLHAPTDAAVEPLDMPSA